VVVDNRDLDWLAAAPAAVAAEPAVRVALAERARRDGDLRTAADLLVTGPPMPSGTPQAATADAVARFVRMWTVGDLQPGHSWVEYLRAAVRRPDPGRRTSLEPPYAELLRGVELALSGDLRAARRTVAACPGRLYADTWAWCAAELLLAALSPEPTERAGSVAARADDLGMPWLSRIAHALGTPGRPADAIAAEIGEADDRGDAWGALLLTAIEAAARLRDRRRAAGVFEELVERCRRLEAPALEAWARSGLALCSATAGLPDAARDAESALGFAHSAQVPGALVLARAAQAVARSDADLRRLAAEEARQVGLGRRWAAWIEARPDTRTPVAATERTPPVAVRCFGGFDIRLDGSAPSLSGVRPRARALLRLLSLYAGQPVHREVLVDAMWPQLDIDAGTHNLHVSISGLRTTLEPGVARGASRLILRDGDRYLLALPPGSTSDLRSFDERLATADRSRASGAADDAIADLEEALRLYVGEVLPEDGPTDWVVPHRDHYQVRAAEGAALLGRLHLDKGRPETAAHALRRSIDIDPCRDASWRLLVAAHEAAGDLAAAEEARRSYADVLTTLGLVATTANTMRTP
jgi:DNA-binding SARP family transcriptional activator